ncbi:uncharacterized protein LOC111392510 [Olea europaea subsp. europaea]|uniref:Uncharacterized protein LOC111392510 n=1 Tax=Olea europaea subsp. europaea TaxID=158383 RepID=A0A8S0SP41_OLEEU|nr:uncharacterized protein LOC111392510 [Olea europaea subsp. europaea]
MLPSFSSDNFSVSSLCKTLMILALLLYLIFNSISNQYPNCPSADFFPLLKKRAIPAKEYSEANSIDSPTNISHLVFGILGSERAWHHRKAYIESWWRPNVTQGYVYLDNAPTGDLVPWSKNSPPYKVSEDLTKFLRETRTRAPVMIRMVHGIMEVFRQEHGNLRWLVMGDDDSIFFVDNIVDVLAKYDHTKYYYFGGQSEFVMSNFWYSFHQGFGGAGFMLSYPLAKALAKDMENCLRRYAHLKSADQITMACIADIGVNLSPHKGLHQIDLRGDISGFLSSHPKSPILSLHHFDMVEPIFPSKDRFESTRHLLRAANVDQSRMMQQTICYHRGRNWTFSISWGYSVHIYQRIMPRSYIQNPIETFKAWIEKQRPPYYMFNTRLPSNDPCEAPHVFFFESIEKTPRNEIFTSYSRASRLGLPACSSNGNHTADFISKIGVISPASKRKEMDRCECCDIVNLDGTKVNVKFRECTMDEIIA